MLKGIRVASVGVLLLVGLICTACGSGDDEEICEPQEYRCGGENGMIVQRCDSRGVRWETLSDCSEYDEICADGQCVSAAD